MSQLWQGWIPKPLLQAGDQTHASAVTQATAEPMPDPQAAAPHALIFWEHF